MNSSEGKKNTKPGNGQKQKGGTNAPGSSSTTKKNNARKRNRNKAKQNNQSGGASNRVQNLPHKAHASQPKNTPSNSESNNNSNSRNNNRNRNRSQQQHPNNNRAKAGNNGSQNGRQRNRTEQSDERPSRGGPSGATPTIKMQKKQILQNGEKGADPFVVPESERIRFTKMLMEFREDPDQDRFEFPPTLTNTERKFVHSLADKIGLKSKSYGKGDNRYITITKVDNQKKQTTEDDDIPVLRVGKKGTEALKRHIKKFPPTNLEELESRETGASLLDAYKKGQQAENGGGDAAVADTLKKLGLGVSKAAPTKERHVKQVDLDRRRRLHAAAQQRKRSNNEYTKILEARAQLPAYAHQAEIVSTVAKNAVTIISGETGCGKSTQIPQFLLDANPTASIVVTQPRRISAISIAERVAQEQCGTDVGQQIGYKVRLESASCKDTQLLFLTPGIMLRQLQSSPMLTEYTHIIIDEIHERDKYTEFLLITLRDLLPQRPDLRLILMSATLQSDSLQEYFSSEEVARISMDGRTFPVQEFFLETVLEMTGFVDSTTAYDGGVDGGGGGGVMSAMELEDELAKVIGDESEVLKCNTCGRTDFSDPFELGEHMVTCDSRQFDFCSATPDQGNDSGPISDAYMVTDEPWNEYEDYNIDEAVANPVMDQVECDVYDEDEEMLPVENSTDGEGEEVDAVTDSGQAKWDGVSPFEITVADSGGPSLKQTELLSQYQSMHDDEEIDYFLLLAVIQYIADSSYGDGAILVFLPGWHEISEFTLLLDSTPPFCNRSQYLTLPLHSGISSRDQRKVLQRPPVGVRKIVLSTNIAETSLTIEDVAFVVDTGRAKEKSYDPHLKTSTLQNVWVSKASAKQRKGRAGRTKAGVCFRLFSSTRHSSMREFTESELLRTPLEEMCLMCKKLRLAPGGPEDEDGVPSFLAKAMSAPHPKSIANALELLVDLGAMEPETNHLTWLGECLSILSVEARVGKMVIWSYLLGCARVACNMAVAMSYKTPFVLPPPGKQRASDESRVRLSRKTESDQATIHFALENMNNQNNGSSFHGFCNRNFLSPNTMRYISDLRKNLSRELKQIGFPSPPTAKNQYYNRHENDYALWQATIAAGLYPNVASRQRGDVNFKTMSNQKVKIHVSSVNGVKGQPLNGKCLIPTGEVEFVCFGEIVKGKRQFTANHTTHLSSPLPLLLLCGTSLCVRPIIISSEEENNNKNDNMSLLTLDDWIVFKCHANVASQIVILRKRLESAFWRAISDPGAGMKIFRPLERDAVEILGTVLQSAHSSSASR